MRDCLDGASARFALQGISDKHSNEDSQVIPILLAASYDGLQVHKHRANNAWILCVTILNLPPNMRYTLGVGRFIVAIIPCLVGSQAEEQVLSLLVDELLLLDRGLLVENPEVRDQRCLAVVCTANDTDIRKGCTHDVRFDDGIDACKLETDNQVDRTFATNQPEMPGVWMYCTR